MHYSVEVGICHDLLKYGLVILDVPGLSESVELDDVVRESLHGMLQLIIYVINGKKTLRIQV